MKNSDKLDQCMDRLPKIPKDWLRWQKKVGITQNFIFIITAAGKIRQDIVVGVKAKFQSAILTIIQWGIAQNADIRFNIKH